MRIAMVTSVSDGTPWADLTTPNHAEYCRRHGYTFIARHLPYEEAVADFQFVRDLFAFFDCVWCLDADAVITNMTLRVEDLRLRGGMNVCEEGLDPNGPIINCGSVILLNGRLGWFPPTGPWEVLNALAKAEPEWRGMKWIWQQWLTTREGLKAVGDLLTIHPVGTFGSCHHGAVNRWTPGAYAYHPCGMGRDERLHNIKGILAQVVR